MSVDADNLALPPHSIEAEQSILGAIMLDNGAAVRVELALREDHFYSDAHRIIYRAMESLRQARSPIDVTTLANALAATGKLDYIGGIAYLGALVQNVPTAAHVEHYADIVIERARLRDLAAVCADIADRARAPNANASAVLALAEVALDSRRYDVLAGELDLALLADTLPQLREWAIHEWAGIGHVTSLYGAGGAGKSLLALLALVCHALGLGFLGQSTTQGRGLGIFCEDDADELHLRLHRICAALDVPMRELAGRIALYPRVGADNLLLYAELRSGMVKATPLYHRLRARLRQGVDCGAAFKLLVLDNIAQLIAVPENDRALVTQAMNYIAGLAQELKLAVLLLGHVAKVAGSQFSGSTAWENVARGRLYLARDEGPDGKPSPDCLTLARGKANYAALDSLPIRYDAGLYRVAGGPAIDVVESIRRRQATDTIRTATIAAVAKLAELKALKPSDSPQAPARYLPKLMQSYGLVPEGITTPAIAAALPGLIKEGSLVIASEYDRRNGRDFRWLALPASATSTATSGSCGSKGAAVAEIPVAASAATTSPPLGGSSSCGGAQTGSGADGKVRKNGKLRKGPTTPELHEAHVQAWRQAQHEAGCHRSRASAESADARAGALPDDPTDEAASAYRRASRGE